MAWTTPLTWVANTVLTASQLNQQVRDNFNETAPAKAITGAGRIFVADGVNSIAERTPLRSSFNDAESTTSTAYGDLATPGPTIIVTTGTSAYVEVAARVRSDTDGQGGFMSVEVSGASTISPSNDRALLLRSPGVSLVTGASYGVIMDSLTAGSNTFRPKYRATESGEATFQSRKITVIPF